MKTLLPLARAHSHCTFCSLNRFITDEPPFALSAARAIRLLAAWAVALAGMNYASAAPLPTPTPGPTPTPTKTARVTGVSTDLPGGDFEMTSIVNFERGPIWESWTMSGGAGIAIAKSGFGFTAENLPLPSGSYCAFLQGSSPVISRDYLFTAGTWRIRFFAAQRVFNGTNRQLVRVTVGTEEVMVVEETNSSAVFQEYVSAPFTVPSGTRRISFRGFNPHGGDNTMLIDAVRIDPVTDFPGGDFEMTSITTHEYRPVWGDWTMSGGAGIAKKSSGFTSKNLPIPSGDYCVFLQGAGATIRRNHTFSAGTYRIRYTAAQRMTSAPNRQAFRVFVNNVEVAEEDSNTPQGLITDYSVYYTRPFTVASGTYEVRFSAFNPNGGDNTALIDDIRLEPVSPWSDAAAWIPSGVPTSTDDVLIPSGAAIAITGNTTTGTVSVEGELLVSNIDSSLSARWVLVHGEGSLFEVGTPASPFQQTFTLELTGNQTEENIMGGGSKFLMAMDKGWIDLHGKPQVSWTKLGATANAGSTQITLAQAVGWNVGDKIVIAPSKQQARQAEVRTITAKTSNNLTLTLDAPLTYMHYGISTTYTRTNTPPTPNRTWTLDQRAEVGLLTHNVKVQGDADSDVTMFGGHIMVMLCGGCSDLSGFSRMSNIELFRMGQRQRLGRYPMHWHMLGSDGIDQYLRDSSVHRSYNRAITIHGSEFVSVERNVAYDHIGHGIFLEDGSERFNKINYNLVLGTIKPTPGNELLPTDNSEDEIQNRSPASYWITNPNNEMIGNVAAGTVKHNLNGATCGTGFWFAFPQNVLGQSALDPRFTGLRPFKEPLGVFRDNVAHSNMTAIDVNDGINPDDTLRKNLGWDPPSPVTLENFTAYANDVALYAGIGNDKTSYSGAVLADNSKYLFLAAYQTVRDSLLVTNGGGSLGSASQIAYVPYDGAGRLRDSHLVGFNSANANLLGNVGASTKHPNHIFSGLTFDLGLPRIVLPSYAGAVVNYAQVNSLANPRVWGTVVRDEDGSTTGFAGRSIIGNYPFVRTNTDLLWPNGANAYVSQHKFGLVTLRYPGIPLPDVNITRRMTGETDFTYIHKFKVDNKHQIPTIVNVLYKYDYGTSLPSNRQISVTTDDLAIGDVTRLQFSGFGSLPGLSVSGMTAHPSLPALDASTTSGYWIQPNGSLWIRFVNTGKSNTTTIRWN